MLRPALSAYLLAALKLRVFLLFSGIVEPVANTSLPDDLPLDVIKTEGEQTLPTDAAPSQFSQVDIKEICEKVIMSWASLKVI